MRKQNIPKAKLSKKCKWLFKIPINKSEFLWIIVGDYKTKLNSKYKVYVYSIKDWLNLYNTGNILPHVCFISAKKCRLKEYVHLFDPFNLELTRKYINTLEYNSLDYTLHINWSFQLAKYKSIIV